MKNTETTRYLCAAAHLDPFFSQQVIQQILHEEYRAVIVPAGLDLFTIVKHCLNARRRRIIRDILLTVILWLAWSYVGYQIEILYYPDPISGFFLTLMGIFPSLFFLVAYTIIATESWITQYEIVAKNLTKGNFHPDCVTLPNEEIIRKKLSNICDEADSNVVVYSGFSPFVGSGVDLGGWSFALDISKGKEEMGQRLEAQPFDVEEIDQFMTHALEKLQLPDLSIRSWLYVNGQEIRDNPQFLPDLLRRPVSQVDPSVMQQFLNFPTESIRHYRCIRVMGWQGELILSTFLRFIKIGDNLFTEVNYFLLTPLKPEYRRIDTLSSSPSLRHRLQTLGGALLSSFFLWPFAPFSLLLTLFNAINRQLSRGKIKRLIRENPVFDYGAMTSIREMASSNLYRQYFQKLDKEMYLKIIQKSILDGIIHFLDQHNINTEEFKERSSTILNNGVMVTGGSIEAQNLTVGDRAKSVLNNITQPIGAKASSESRKTSSLN
ncbi:hypothetical protein ACN4EG_24215 [Alkalinema pantanalense CENA528]|uniref:hypothetical protein n=1 Tax=Alkalinema pantanalense TaxID=1620705 RepID=UPI003D6F7AF6